MGRLCILDYGRQHHLKRIRCDPFTAAYLAIISIDSMACGLEQGSSPGCEGAHVFDCGQSAVVWPSGGRGHSTAGRVDEISRCEQQLWCPALMHCLSPALTFFQPLTNTLVVQTI